MILDCSNNAACGLAQEERRRSQALKESREQLIAIVQAWSFARSFDDFFEDMQHRVSTLPAEQRDAILDRIAQARAMLGGTDPVCGELMLMRRLVFGTAHDSVGANDKT